MTLALRLKDKVTCIFSVAAICSFFLVMTIVSFIPSTEITEGGTTFIASLVVVGFVFVAVALINVFFLNMSAKPKKNKPDGDGE